MRKIRRRRRQKEKDTSELIKPVSELEPEINVVLYGRSGTGKTTLAGTFPKPVLFIDCSDHGTDSVRDVDDAYVIRCDDWALFEKVYEEIDAGKHSRFKTLVIDTVSALEFLKKKAFIEDRDGAVDEATVNQWGMLRQQDYAAISSELITKFIHMRDWPQCVVFIAQDRDFSDKDDDGISADPKVGPRLMPSVMQAVNASCGWIGNTYIDVAYRKVKNPKTKKTIEKKIVKYSLQIGPDDVFITKMRKPTSRTLPDTIVNPTYQKLLAIVTGSDDEEG